VQKNNVLFTRGGKEKDHKHRKKGLGHLGESSQAGSSQFFFTPKLATGFHYKK